MFKRSVELARREDGTLTIFMLITFISMITLAGFAIDVARLELERTKIQLAVDHSALAAASMRQAIDPATNKPRTPSEIVDLYMAKADIPENFRQTYQVQDEVELFEATNTEKKRRVEIRGGGSVSTIFMKMVGVNTLEYGVRSAALETKLDPIEISLVLDISGSMDEPTKLSSLISGAKEFVDTMLAANTVEDPHAVSISLVPYSAYVNAGKDLSAVFENQYKDFSQMVVPRVREFMLNEGQCGFFKDTAFNSTQPWATDDFVPKMSYAESIFNSVNGNQATTDEYIKTPWCPDFWWSEVLPVSGDAAELKRRLNAFGATTNTSIDDGALWGAVLLDPASRSKITKLVNGDFVEVSGYPQDKVNYVDEEVYETDGDGNILLDLSGNPIVEEVVTRRVTTSTQAIDEGYLGRPLDYGKASKIMVLMTDGFNTDQYRLKDTYSADWGGSTAAAKEPGGRYFYFNTYSNGSRRPGVTWTAGYTGGGWAQLDWQSVFAVWEVNSFRNIYVNGNRIGWSWSTGKFQQTHKNHDQKNARLQNICNAAKEVDSVTGLPKMRIYTITYEATPYAAGIMENCATDGSAFVATADTISSVFANIAQSARKLQLVQ